MYRQEFFVVCQAGCGKRYTFDIDPEDYERFRQGTFAQIAFPYLTADQRELMVSQTCGSCFDKMFPPEDDGSDDSWYELVDSLDQMARSDLYPARTRAEDDEGEDE